ncbi:GSCOCG00013642001-RA-CDS [Cotesia congregata]|nr:GSCOCG00013642001-RA-CDS [Cotesia congregata]
MDNGYLYFGKHTMTLWMSNSQAFENIVCTENDVLISVYDNFTHLKEHIRPLGSPYHPINGDTKQISGLPSNINLKEYTIIGMFGDADNLILACYKEKAILKIRIKVPKSAQSTYEIYNFTLITLDDSNARTTFHCYIPHSDVMVIANGTHLWISCEFKITDDFSHYLRHVNCNRVVTSITMHCNIILAGLNNGTILVVNLKYDQDQIRGHIVLNKRLRINNVDDPIISLNIDEINDRSRIIAGTKSTIKYLDF